MIKKNIEIKDRIVTRDDIPLNFLIYLTRYSAVDRYLKEVELYYQYIQAGEYENKPLIRIYDRVFKNPKRAKTIREFIVDSFDVSKSVYPRCYWQNIINGSYILLDITNRYLDSEIENFINPKRL